MRKLAYEVAPPGISIGIREMIPSRNPSKEDIKLYQSLTESGTKIQHICYEPEDLDLLSDLLDKGKISKDGTWYSADGEFESDNEIIEAFYICNRTAAITKCDADSLSKHKYVFQINWSRFGNVNMEKWNIKKNEWVQQ